MSYFRLKPAPKVERHLILWERKTGDNIRPYNFDKVEYYYFRSKMRSEAKKLTRRSNLMRNLATLQLCLTLAGFNLYFDTFVHYYSKHDTGSSILYLPGAFI